MALFNYSNLRAFHIENRRTPAYICVHWRMVAHGCATMRNYTRLVRNKTWEYSRACATMRRYTPNEIKHFWFSRTFCVLLKTRRLCASMRNYTPVLTQLCATKRKYAQVYARACEEIRWISFRFTNLTDCLRSNKRCISVFFHFCSAKEAEMFAFTNVPVRGYCIHTQVCAELREIIA